MSDLGDRIREFADLVDKHEKMTCAGLIAKPNETICAVFAETHDDPVSLVARGLYYGALEPEPAMPSPFAELRPGTPD